MVRRWVEVARRKRDGDAAIIVFVGRIAHEVALVARVQLVGLRAQRRGAALPALVGGGQLEQARQGVLGDGGGSDLGAALLDGGGEHLERGEQLSGRQRGHDLGEQEGMFERDAQRIMRGVMGLIEQRSHPVCGADQRGALDLVALTELAELGVCGASCSRFISSQRGDRGSIGHKLPRAAHRARAALAGGGVGDPELRSDLGIFEAVG